VVVVVGGVWLHPGLPCWQESALARLGLKFAVECVEINALAALRRSYTSVLLHTGLSMHSLGLDPGQHRY
jgi:hypothetical protein